MLLHYYNTHYWLTWEVTVDELYIIHSNVTIHTEWPMTLYHKLEDAHKYQPFKYKYNKKYQLIKYKCQLVNEKKFQTSDKITGLK